METIPLRGYKHKPHAMTVQDKYGTLTNGRKGRKLRRTRANRKETDEIDPTGSDEMGPAWAREGEERTGKPK